MINLCYSEAYWGHSATMNGPHKVVDNLIKSLEQEKIDYAINEEKYIATGWCEKIESSTVIRKLKKDL